MQQTNKSTILAVIVLYNIKLEDSSTYNTLKIAIAASSSTIPIDMVVYDNSAASQIVPTNFSTKIKYIHDIENGGISKAYNFALDFAIQRGYDWLLLLDQDSVLPSDFITNCVSDIKLQQDRHSVVAIVPTVYCCNNIISPCKVGFGGKVTPIIVNRMQVPTIEITAINSGTLVKVSYLKFIGGFNNRYWLDMLDHWLFKTIYHNNKCVVIGDSSLVHDLSIQNYSTISLDRYHNIIKAENHFNYSNCSIVNYIFFKFRLVIRSLKFIFIHKRGDLSLLTLRYLFKTAD